MIKLSELKKFQVKVKSKVVATGVSGCSGVESNTFGVQKVKRIWGLC